MFGRKRKWANARDEWWGHLYFNDTAHVCDDVPERPPGHRRVVAVLWEKPVKRLPSGRLAYTEMRIKLEGDDRWWSREQLHVDHSRAPADPFLSGLRER